MLSSALGAGRSSIGDPKKRILTRIGKNSFTHRFQAGSRFTTMRKQESLAPSDPSQYTLGILPELQHGYGFHNIKFKLKLFISQALPGALERLRQTIAWAAHGRARQRFANSR
jgi:hypothetical protein